MAVFDDIFHEVCARYAEAIASAFKELLENKHLYQSVKVNRDIMPSESTLKLLEKPSVARLEKAILLTFHEPWTARINIRHTELLTRMTGETHTLENEVIFYLPSIKTFCPTCQRLEPHNPRIEFISGLKISREKNITILNLEPGVSYAATEQAFTFGYQCQGCSDPPVIFLVYRSENNITLVGRNPMEAVEVPKYIPEKTKRFYSQAIVARRTNYTLAGNFLLRTFIEQTVFGEVNNPEQYGKSTDLLLDAYMATLHQSVRSDSPSLRVVYDYLSDDMHLAKGSEEVFEKAFMDINAHFELKDIYKRLKPTTKSAAAR